MNKTTKWLTALVVVLAVANIGLLTLLWQRNNVAAEDQPHKYTRDFFVQNLSLNKSQTVLFDSLQADYFKRVDDLKRKLRFVKERLFGLLAEKDTNEIKRRITGYLRGKTGELQAAIDVETFTHFSKLRSLLNEQQKEKFDETIQDILRAMGQSVRTSGDSRSTSPK